MSKKLTARVVDAALPEARPRFLWCSALPGFGVRIFPSGVKTFYADYYNEAGQRRRMSIGALGKLTVEEARKRALSILGAAVKGGDPAEERVAARRAIRVDELCQRYLKAAEAGAVLNKRGQPKKARTVAADRSRIARHVIPQLGNKPVAKVTPADINQFIRAVITNTSGDGLSVARRSAGMLSSIFSFAITEGFRGDNPCRGVRRPADKQRQRYLTEDEYRALGAALRKANSEAAEPMQLIGIIIVLALTGCRSSEIVNLKWTEIDFKQHCLRLADSKEGASIRPLGQPALAFLGKLKRDGDFVFPASKRNHGGWGGLQHGWRRIVGKLDISPHTLRHSYATMANAQGCALPTIKALLGHSAGSVTEKYVHVIDSALIAAADKVAGTISELMFPRSKGRASKADDGCLLEMAMVKAQWDKSDREAADIVTARFRKRPDDEAPSERLRKKYRKDPRSMEREAWARSMPEFDGTEQFSAGAVEEKPSPIDQCWFPVGKK